MTATKTPSTVMYGLLKSCGVSNQDAASILLNTQLTFDGHTLANRIEDSSQLSRRIVHTVPGELAAGIFNSFQISCPQLEQTILRRLVATRRDVDEGRARELLRQALTGTGSADMAEALVAHQCDDALYHNMETYIRHVELEHEDDRTLLHLMLFVVTGCLGNPRTASYVVMDYATNILKADFHTASTIVREPLPEDVEPAEEALGLVRVVDGRIRAGSKIHVLYAGGTQVGLLPSGRHIVADVDEDVSRNHARIWREQGVWRIVDLGSTHGTRLIPGAGGEELAVGTDEAQAPQLEATDIVCLGATTRFIVIPVM